MSIKHDVRGAPPFIRQTAPWIALSRRAPLTAVEKLSNQLGPALFPSSKELSNSEDVVSEQIMKDSNF